VRWENKNIRRWPILLVISVPKICINGQFYFNLSSKRGHMFFGTQCSTASKHMCERTFSLRVNVESNQLKVTILHTLKNHLNCFLSFCLLAKTKTPWFIQNVAVYFRKLKRTHGVHTSKGSKDSVQIHSILSAVTIPVSENIMILSRNSNRQRTPPCIRLMSSL